MSGPDERRRDPLRTLLALVGALTAATGAAEILAPRPVLRVLGADADRTAAQLFATVGMFMVVVGGLLTRTLLRPRPDPDVVGWAALQKAGAAVAVTAGVRRGVFRPVALLVAGFDALTSVLLVALRWRSRGGQEAGAP